MMYLNINKSRVTIAAVLVLHAGALLLTFALTALGGLGQLLLAAGIVSSALWQRRLADGFQAMTWRLDDDGHCIGPDRAGDEVRYHVAQAYCHPAAIRLLLRHGRRRARLLFIARDALDAGHYRELCARITQRRLPVPGAATPTP